MEIFIDKEIENFLFTLNRGASFVTLSVFPRILFNIKSLSFKEKFNINELPYMINNNKFCKNLFDIIKQECIFSYNILNNIKNSYNLSEDQKHLVKSYIINIFENISLCNKIYNKNNIY